jgi:hypothetical protein
MALIKLMATKQESDQYMKDSAEWQDKQYLPGYYLGGKMPLPLKQLGKKRWFRGLTAVYLTILGLALAFAIFQMIRYIFQSSY